MSRRHCAAARFSASRRALRVAWAVVAVLAIEAGSAGAQPTRFTVVAEAGVFSRGEGELTQAAVLAPGAAGTPGVVDWQLALDIGIADRLQLGVGLPVVCYEWSTSRLDSDGLSAWGMWGVADGADGVGGGFALTVLAGIAQTRHERCAEAGLLAQRELGAWTIAYNGFAGRMWPTDAGGEPLALVRQGLGVSRSATGWIHVGGELVHEAAARPGEGWTSAVQAGPTLAMDTALAWLAVTPLWRLDTGATPGRLTLNLLVGRPF
ncbi:MAG: hypothetical protein R6X25_16535 [Candidatus Krumholzibacteriia bacterium]